jgi:hypothetical protein
MEGGGKRNRCLDINPLYGYLVLQTVRKPQGLQSRGQLITLWYISKDWRKAVVAYL